MRTLGEAVAPRTERPVRGTAELRPRAEENRWNGWQLARKLVDVSSLDDSLLAVARCAVRGRHLQRPAPPGPARVALDVLTDAALGVWDFLQGRLDGRGLCRHILASLLAAAGAALILVLLCHLTASWAPALQLLLVTAAAGVVRSLVWRLVAAA